MKMSTWGFAGIFALAATAAAIAVVPLRITAFVPEGKGVLENPAGDGMAKLKFYVDPVVGDSIEAHIHLHQFMANTQYSFIIDTEGGGADFVDIVTTNPDGDANVKFSFPVSVTPTWAAIVVYRNQLNDGGYTPDDPDTLLVNEDECRAVGVQGL